MKKLGLILLSFVMLSTSSFADCRDVAKDSKIRLFEGDEQFWMAGGAYFGALFIPAIASATFVAAIPVAVAVPGVYVLIKNNSKNRYIKLVNQAEAYVASNGEEKAGKLLRKFKKGLDGHSELSLLEVATFIQDGNNNNLFCPEDKFINIRGVKKHFNSNEIKEIEI